ncbi:MAG: PspC domain protein, partial [Actinomycetia bacterium]|nr:PspC domain protein [Actinomycetes bacterium]
MSTPEAPPRRLTRSPSDRMVAGVCGGLAEFTGIDPVIFRVVVAVATLMGGAGLVAYGIAWLVIPSADDAQSHAESLLRDRHVPRIGLIGIGILALIITGSLDGWGNHWGGGGGFGLLVVVAIGIWLWTRDDHTVPPRPPTPSAPPSRPLVAAEIPTDDVTVPVPPVPPTRHRPRRHRRPRRPRSKLLALTFSAVVLTAGILAAIDLSGAAQVRADTALAICLIVVGAGLLVGSVAGRPGGLFAIGLLLTAATAVAAVADVPLSGGAGDRYWQPTGPSTLERTYELA